ncbi:MAG: hemerythrin [Clostridiaceae bacterium]|jgi:hemerythrin-like domain-containing protein|nr:hemerythrin [Clostridiaceae bacterium]
MECISKDLRKEHDAILFGLTILEHMAELVRAESGYDVDDLKGMIDFFRYFADKCHHGKEEDILFPAMEDAGIPKVNGPIGVMLNEHEVGRKLIKGMDMAITGDEVDKEEFANAADLYVELLRSHINKENNVLFPMGDRRIPVSRQKELQQEFDKFERDIMGDAKLEEVHSFIEDMEVKYLH